MIKLMLIVITMAIFMCPASAQDRQDDTSYKVLYEQKLPYFQELITGGLYAHSPSNYGGDPFYNTRVFETGSLSINNIVYANVLLLYDNHADMVLTFHPIYKQKILIKPEKIDDFTLEDGTVFRHFKSNSSYNHDNNGFYEVIYDHDIKVLAKHYKESEAVNEIGHITREYVSYDDYFLFFDGKFEIMNKKKHAISKLGMNKKSVKKHFRSKNLVFKFDRKEYLIELVKLQEMSGKTFEGFYE